MPDDLTDEQKRILAEQQEEAAYKKFAGWLDKYAEEKKPAPDKTDKGENKPGFNIFSSLFGGQ